MKSQFTAAVLAAVLGYYGHHRHLRPVMTKMFLAGIVSFLIMMPWKWIMSENNVILEQEQQQQQQYFRNNKRSSFTNISIHNEQQRRQQPNSVSLLLSKKSSFPKQQQRCHFYDNNDGKDYYYPNFIVYDRRKHNDQAGLADRIYLMEELLLPLTNILCARLIIPSPHDMLTPIHNFGKEAFNVTDDDNDGIPSTMILNYKDDINNNDRENQKWQWLDPLTTKDQFTSQLSNILQLVHLQQEQQQHYESTSSSNKSDDGSSIATTTYSSPPLLPFVWNIDVNFYLLGEDFDAFYNNYRHPFVDHDVVKWSKIVKSEYAPHVRQTVQRVKERICHHYQQQQQQQLAISRSSSSSTQPNNETEHDVFKSCDYGHLHLRRGDVKNVECDTRLVTLESWLNCTFFSASTMAEWPWNNSTTTSSARFPLLVQTDEMNSRYRKGVKRLIERIGFRYIDLDWMVRQVLKEQIFQQKEISHENFNNYQTFVVEHAIAKESTFHLARRRTVECHTCDDSIKILRKAKARAILYK